MKELLLVSDPDRCGGNVTIGHSRLPVRVVVSMLPHNDDAAVLFAFPSLDAAALPLLRLVVADIRLALENDDGPARKLEAIRELLEEWP